MPVQRNLRTHLAVVDGSQNTTIWQALAHPSLRNISITTQCGRLLVTHLNSDFNVEESTVTETGRRESL